MPLETWFRAGCFFTDDRWIVEGAGTPGIDGVYVRTKQKCDGADAFRKKGTRFIIMRRGNFGWSLNDVGGKNADKWSLYTSELYRVERTPAGFAPPELGWQAVDGHAPGPSLRRPKNPVRDASASLPYLRESADDDLLNGTGKPLKEDLLHRKVKDPRGNTRKDASQIPGLASHTLPQAVPLGPLNPEWCKEWGLRDDACIPPLGEPNKRIQVKSMPVVQRSASESTLSIRAMSRSVLQASMSALKLKGLPPLHAKPPNLLKMPGECVDVVQAFRVVLWRPSSLIPWGFKWSDGAFQAQGSRVLASVEKWSPLGRWNTWQQIRGRPELLVRPNDRLLKVDGAWAFYENEVGSQDGDLAVEAIQKSANRTDGGADETGGCIVLDFARPVVRPAPPPPPQAQALEDHAMIKITWVSEADNVLAWAICMKDLTVGQWLFVNGRSEIAKIVSSGEEIASFRPERVRSYDVADVGNGDLVQNSRLLWKGLCPGRPYAACIALLTDRGWSAFSELSRPTALLPAANNEALVTYYSQYYKIDPNPEQDEESLDRHYYCLPTEILPGSSAPLALMHGNRELRGERRCLRLQTMLQGSAQGLRVKNSGDGNNQSIVVTHVDKGSPVDRWYEDVLANKSMTLHGGVVVPALRPDDQIVRINGVVGAAAMLTELRRNPTRLAIRFERLSGGFAGNDFGQNPPGKIKHIRIDPTLDENLAKLAEEIHSNILMDQDEGALAVALIENDCNTLEEIIHCAAIAAQHSNADRYEPLLREAEKRLLIFRRRAEIDAAADANDAEGELDTEEQEDRAILGLRCALGDIACDPESLGVAIAVFENASLAVQNSKVGMALKDRALALQRLWEWRVEATKAHNNLVSTLQESLVKEFSSTYGNEEGRLAVADADSDETLVTEFLADAIEECTPYLKYGQLEYDYREATEVLQRHKQINVRDRAHRMLEAAINNPRADEGQLTEAVANAEEAKVPRHIVARGKTALVSWTTTSEQTLAVDELFTAMRELRVHAENRSSPGVGAEEQRRVRAALIKAQLPEDHEYVREAAVLLRKWESDNICLRVEARLVNAIQRARMGYKEHEPRAGDLLGCAIAEVAQQGVGSGLLEEAREVLEEWYESRKSRAEKDLAIAREYKDEKFLKEAIEFGEEAGVDEQLLDESKYDLQRLQWEEEVNRVLDHAMEANDLESIVIAVQRAHQGFFTEDVSVMLQAGTLQAHLRYWAETFQQVTVAKNAQGLEIDVQNAYVLIEKAEEAMQKFIKDDQSNNKGKEKTPEVVLRTIERDIRRLQLVMPRTRDMAAVYEAEQAILKVLGGVEKYADELPDVIQRADAQVPKGLNKTYVNDAKKHLKEYRTTIANLSNALKQGDEIPTGKLKSAIIQARLAGAPQDLVEKGAEMLEQRDPDMHAYMGVELELLIAKAEADDIKEVDVQERFLRLQTAADDAKRLQPPLDEEILEEVHDYSMALAAEKALVELVEEAKLMLNGDKPSSPEDIAMCCKKLDHACTSADRDALDEVKKMIPEANDTRIVLEKEMGDRAKILIRVQKLSEIKTVPVLELKQAIVAAREAFLPQALLDEAYSRLRRRKLEFLPTDIRASMASNTKAVTAGLWQRGLVYKAHDAFSDWQAIARDYEGNVGRHNVLAVEGHMDGTGGSFGTHRWRQNPYWVIQKKPESAKQRMKKVDTAKAKAIKVTAVVAEMAQSPSNLVVHAVRNRMDVATAAAAAKCPFVLAPGPEVLASSSDDKGIPSCTFELPPPDDDWPVFIVPSAALREEGPFMLFIDATAPVDLIFVGDDKRSPWKHDENVQIKWADERPFSKIMGGGRSSQKAPALPWYRNPQFRIRWIDEHPETPASRPMTANRFSLGGEYEAQAGNRQTLKIRIFSARGLRNADYIHGHGTSDPYCTVEAKGDYTVLTQTEVIPENTSPVWNHEAIITDYVIGQDLVFTIWDHDEGKTDDFLGEFVAYATAIFPQGFGGEYKIAKAGVKTNGIAVEAFIKLDISLVGSSRPPTAKSNTSGDAKRPQSALSNSSGNAKRAQSPKIDMLGATADKPAEISPPIELPQKIEEMLRDIFKKCDTRGDGNVEKRELIAICRSSKEVADFFELPNTKRDTLEELFQNLDVSGDKEVSWEEFRSFYIKRFIEQAPPQPPQIMPSSSAAAAELYPQASFDADDRHEADTGYLKEVFKMCDQKANNKIDKRELIKIVRSNADVAIFFGLPGQIRQEDGSRDKMERLFQHLDANDDREISWEEFSNFYTSQVVVVREESGQLRHVIKDGSAEKKIDAFPIADKKRLLSAETKASSPKSSFGSRPHSGSGKSSRPGTKDKRGRGGSARSSDSRPAPLLLVTMVPERGIPQSPYALHIVQNRPGTVQYTDQKVVENFFGHNMIASGCPKKKKMGAEYQKICEVGAACKLTRSETTGEGEFFFVVPSLETISDVGSYSLRFLSTVDISIDMVE